jgi:hypothetical protein
VIFSLRSGSAETSSGRSPSRREKVVIGSVKDGLVLADNGSVQEGPASVEGVGGALGVCAGVPFVNDLLDFSGVLFARNGFDCEHQRYQ